MHSVGGNCVFASELDKYARISYEANYKEIAPSLFENNYQLFNADINDADLILYLILTYVAAVSHVKHSLLQA
jgi:site-specific DNA-cytosine methylase